MMRLLRAAALGVFLCTLAGSAAATPIFLSEMSSDATPASDLTAEFDFSYGGGILTLEVTNFTTAPNEFNISEIYFNAVATVTGLTLLSATHSAEGDVLAAWTPVVTNTIVDGFGSFDFGLTDGVGETDVNLIGPSESVLFTFSVSGSATGDVTPGS